jgi:hypothetical protein
MKLHALFLVFGLVAADISAQLFEQAECTLIDDNEIVANVHSDESDKFGSSKCQAPGPFKSVNIVSIDAGFQCNYYKDAACQDFKGSFTVPGCVTASGEGIICFNQGAFGNPLAQSKAQVTLGLQKIQAMVSGEAGKTQDFATTIAKQIGAACEDNGCDPNPSTPSEFDNSECTFPGDSGWPTVSQTSIRSLRLFFCQDPGLRID